MLALQKQVLWVKRVHIRIKQNVKHIFLFTKIYNLFWKLMFPFSFIFSSVHKFLNPKLMILFLLKL